MELTGSAALAAALAADWAVTVGAAVCFLALPVAVLGLVWSLPLQAVSILRKGDWRSDFTAASLFELGAFFGLLLPHCAGASALQRSLGMQAVGIALILASAFVSKSLFKPAGAKKPA